MLSSTSAPSFTDMVIENNAADGINGSQVNGFTLAGSTVSGNGTQANVTGEHNDDGLDFSPERRRLPGRPHRYRVDHQLHDYRLRRQQRDHQRHQRDA